MGIRNEEHYIDLTAHIAIKRVERQKEREKMYKSCSRCGKIHSINYKCNINKPIITKETDEKKLRSKWVWTEKAREIKTKANYLCEVCRDKGLYRYKTLEVHHIIKIKHDKSKFLDNNNLICLCRECHTKADKGEIDLEYLRKLVNAREKDPPAKYG